MIREEIASGVSVDEARRTAAAKLNAPENADVQFEVISAGSKKILGIFGGSEAKVRAFYEDPDIPDVKKSAGREKKVKHRSETDSSAARTVQSPSEKKAASKGTNVPDDSPAPAYIKEILSKMGVSAEVSATECDGELYINIQGEGTGAVIGHHGETLDALQHLATIVANRREKVYSRVFLDCGDYREKRAESLKSLAENIAAQSIRNHRNIALEPMNPYERRIIHTAVQSIDGVTSWSTGEEPVRRVVIGNDGFEPVKFYGRRNDRRGSGRYSGGRRNDRGRKEPYKPDDSSLREKKTEHNDVALYGKIN